MSEPLLLVSDEHLVDEVLRLSAVAGASIRRVSDAADARPLWSNAPIVVVDSDGARACASAGLARRAGVHVVSNSQAPMSAWQAAVAVGAQGVLGLPDDEAALVTLLSDAVDAPAATGGQVLSVLGARGGAGASTFCCELAISTAMRGQRVLLVDCDPLGAGLDLTLGMEEADGLRWSGLSVTGGRIAASSLHEALPQAEFGNSTVSLLSCDRTGYRHGLTAQGVRSVVEAGRRAGDVVVCDLPRTLSESTLTAVEQSDLALLMVPSEVRACASGALLGTAISERGTAVRAILRGPSPGGLKPADVAQALSAQILTSMRAQPGLPSILERGGLGRSRRGPLAAAAAAVLDELDSLAPLGSAAPLGHAA